MKILISSKQLASDLNQINFQNDTVIGAYTMSNILNKSTFLVLITHHGHIMIGCQILQSSYGSDNILYQTDRRWDWVKKLVDAVKDQPIVLDIKETSVNVMFSY